MPVILITAERICVNFGRYKKVDEIHAKSVFMYVLSTLTSRRFLWPIQHARDVHTEIAVWIWTVTVFLLRILEKLSLNKQE